MTSAAVHMPSRASADAGSWVEANQRYLSAEFARLKAPLADRLDHIEPRNSGPRDENDLDRAVDDARAALTVTAPIDFITDVFGLTPFERAVLLLAAAVEMDSSVATACARASGRTDSSPLTFSVALATLPEPHWSALLPERPLRRQRLIEIESGMSLTLSPLHIDERVLHFIAGINGLDARLQTMVRPLMPPQLVAPSQGALAATILGDIAARGPVRVLQLHGEDRDGQYDVAALVATELGWSTFVVHGDDLPSSAVDRSTLTTLWTREAALLGAALFVEIGSSTQGQAAAEFIDAVDGPVFVGARVPLTLRRDSRLYAVPRPGRLEQRELWRAVLRDSTVPVSLDVDLLASHVPLSARAIARLAPDVTAGRDVRLLLRTSAEPSRRGALDELAQPIEPRAGWDDLVVPPATRRLLEEIAAHARHRCTVYDEWGFAARGPRGLGITALFVGESGTGKTMAAEVLARDLGIDLYRIDLASVVSKYIGETEKNLRRIFEAAEASGAILLFDEADALFGKRSDVKDSHDRYANIEVSYLLQRMEAYAGLAILTTNMKAALDRAFQRRLRFIVHFPFPDAAQRAGIWRKVFPPQTPISGIDIERLSRLGIAGGTITNIALRAAFRAARAGEPVGMTHVVDAARGEYEKLERTFDEAEWRGRS
jgi:hypothetical protein